MLALSSCSATNVVPDPAFRSCLNGLLGQQADDPVTASQLRHLSAGPNCQNKGIRSVEGVQYLTGVDTVILAQNQISDLTPLAKLTNLQWVFLGNNEISDLAPLAKLSNLIRLDVSNNQIVDLSPLSGLTRLVTLNVESNQIADVSPLANLTGLTTLWLDNNHISDLTTLAQTSAASSSGYSDFVAHSQSLTATATVGVAQPLPPVKGLAPLTWTVWQGDGTISGDTVTYPTAGTVTLAFSSADKLGFAGLVTVTVT